MVKIYKNGEEFISENKEFLDENKYMSTFFYVDAKVLDKTDNINYAIKYEANGKKLLGMRVEPYNLCLYGDKECSKELLEFIDKNNYIVPGLIAPAAIGDFITTIDSRYRKSIGMDFMETKEKTEESSNEVVKATFDDVDELFNCVSNFIKDCGLPDKPDKNNIAKKLNNFRIIKDGNLIVSMAAISDGTTNSKRITFVYTRPEYRGKSYARKVVNTSKNEILDMGLIATLNVDQKNPISNHLYESLGFKKVFSQGIYDKTK